MASRTAWTCAVVAVDPMHQRRFAAAQEAAMNVLIEYNGEFLTPLQYSPIRLRDIPHRPDT